MSRLAIFLYLTALTLPVLCEEKPTKEEFLPIEVFFDELDWTPVADNHEYTKVVREYLMQLSALEGLRDPSPQNVSLRNKMRDPASLKQILALAKARLEKYKDSPEANKETRRQDLTSLVNSIAQLETRVAAKGVAGVAESKNRRPTAKEREEISQFLKKFSELLRAEKYVDLAKNNLEFQEELKPADLAKVLPQIVEKLEGHVQDGCLTLIDDLQNGGEWWMTSPDDAILFASGSKKGVFCLHRAKSGWKCCHITMGDLSELDAIGIPKK